jgi:putative membrane protein
MNDLLVYVPYCGIAPLPAEIWSRWNLDPALLAVLAILMLWHGLRLNVFSGSAAVERYPRNTFFVGGWGALALGLISPLCALSVALFSARVTQHMWLMLIAAPLLVLAHRRTRADVPVRRARVTPFNAAALFAISLWIWHTPRLYAMTFQSDAVYWLMHVTMTGSALMLWHALLCAPSRHLLARASAGFVTLVHMGLLGALITLAPRVLYDPHLLTAPTWNLTALEDQQLGGLIMWVPTGAVFLIAALVSIYGALKAHERSPAL